VGQRRGHTGRESLHSPGVVIVPKQISSTFGGFASFACRARATTWSEHRTHQPSKPKLKRGDTHSIGGLVPSRVFRAKEVLIDLEDDAIILWRFVYVSDALLERMLKFFGETALDGDIWKLKTRHNSQTHHQRNRSQYLSRASIGQTLVKETIWYLSPATPPNICKYDKMLFRLLS
jgi:hypothetical protein